MQNNNLSIGSPIKSFIEAVKNESSDALGDWELKAPIELELNAIVNGNIGGSLDIQIINFGAKVQAEQQQKIKFSIGPKDATNEAEKQARIEASKAEELKHKLSAKIHAERLRKH